MRRVPLRREALPVPGKAPPETRLVGRPRSLEACLLQAPSQFAQAPSTNEPDRSGGEAQALGNIGIGPAGFLEKEHPNQFLTTGRQTRDRLSEEPVSFPFTQRFPRNLLQPRFDLGHV